MNNSINKLRILIYCILIVSSSLAALIAVRNIVLSTDSITYGLVSQQIIAGRGIRIPVIGVIFGFDNTVPVDGTVPFLSQPPLMPILLAILGGLTPQSSLAAQILNFTCHVGISIFTFLLMRNVYNNEGIALLTGILVSISHPLLRIAHHAASEAVFIPLTLAAIYFLAESRNSRSNQFRRNLVLAGIIASASILTRYAGIALLAVFLWEAFILIKNDQLRSKCSSIILAISIPVVTVAILFTRNYINAGSIRGFNVPSPAPERSYLDAYIGTIKMLFAQFQLDKYSGFVIILFMMIFILCIIINASLRKEVWKNVNTGLDSIIIFVISYTALIVVTLAKDQPYFELRYVSPLVPFLFIIGVFIIVFLWDRVKISGFSKLSLLGMILSLGIITAGTCYKTFINLQDFFYKQDKLYFILQSCTYNWVKANYADKIIITTNEPYRLSFFGGYSTLILPSRKWVPNATITENTENILPHHMLKVGSHVLVLFNEVREEHYGSYIAGLFNRRDNDSHFKLVHECSDGVVYDTKK